MTCIAAKRDTISNASDLSLSFSLSLAPALCDGAMLGSDLDAQQSWVQPSVGLATSSQICSVKAPAINFLNKLRRLRPVLYCPRRLTFLSSKGYPISSLDAPSSGIPWLTDYSAFRRWSCRIQQQAGQTGWRASGRRVRQASGVAQNREADNEMYG